MVETKVLERIVLDGKSAEAVLLGLVGKKILVEFEGETPKEYFVAKYECDRMAQIIVRGEDNRVLWWNGRELRDLTPNRPGRKDYYFKIACLYKKGKND